MEAEFCHAEHDLLRSPQYFYRRLLAIVLATVLTGYEPSAFNHGTMCHDPRS
jgi:hypothetical protein